MHFPVSPSRTTAPTVDAREGNFGRRLPRLNR